MSIVTVNAELAVKSLQQNGFDLEQARGIVEVIKSSRAELATKGDLVIQKDLRLLEQRLTIKLGGVGIATVGILFTLLQFFPPGSLAG